MIVERPADTKRLAILDLLSRGYRPVQIAGELDVSRQYVHLIRSRLIAGLLHDHPLAPVGPPQQLPAGAGSADWRWTP
jgi:hypothetical protein